MTDFKLTLTLQTFLANFNFPCSSANMQEVSEQAKIFNGQNAYVPWQVSLIDTWTNTHICGGTILNAFVVLTAAHCLLRRGRQANETSTKYYYRKSYELRIVAGQYSLKWRDPTEQIRHVETWVADMSYTNSSDSDFAVLFLKTPLRFNDKVRPLPLPSDFEVHKGNLTISGWGRERVLPGGIIDNVDTLQTTNLKIISNEECQEWHPNRTIFETMFCAISPNNVSAVCKGDSGSPAVCTETTEYVDPPHIVERQVLCGIASFTKGGNCTVSSNGDPVDMYPTVFVRVSEYLGWLNVQIRKIKYPGWWMCDDFQFIREDERCDFKHDCEDWSDETHCTKETNTTTLKPPASSTTGSFPLKCSMLEFECEVSQECIPLAWRCDGREDCFYGEDELLGCPNATAEAEPKVNSTTPELVTTTTSRTNSFTTTTQFLGNNNETSIISTDLTPSDKETDNNIARRRNLKFPPPTFSAPRSNNEEEDCDSSPLN